MLKNTKQEQTGRSMVEMLGVLAVIGVLSVAGIAGYTTAINKHKANEILNGASVRAMHVAAQIQSGSSSPSLTEFTDNTVGGATFKTTVTKTDSQFSLGVEDVDSDVCEQITNLVGDSSNVNVSDDCDTFTYNNDLSAPVSTGATCTPACESDEECVDGICIDKANSSNNSCAKNADCADKAMCSGKTCYCAISADSDANYPNCSYSNYTGTCAVVSKASSAPTGYTASSGTMNWWSAVNFCKAVDGHLVSLAEVGCEGDGTTPSYNSDLTDKGYPDNFWTTAAASCDEDWNCTIGTSNTSCRAYRVGTYYEYVFYNSRDYDYYALCE